MTVRLLRRSAKKTRHERGQDQGQGKDHHRESRLSLRCCFKILAGYESCGSRPDAQEGDHEFPRVIVEGPAKLRNEQAAQRSRGL